MVTQQRFMTTVEAAEYLRLTPGALYVQRHRDEGPGNLAVKVGRRLVYRTDDIERWFDAQLAEKGIGVGA